MKKNLCRILALLMAVCLLCGVPISVCAASTENAVIDPDAPCSITLYKYDFTSAKADGAWGESYVSTGTSDENVEKALSEYAIEGVEFSYLKVADIYTFTERIVDGEKIDLSVRLLYGFDKESGAALLAALGLENGKGSYSPVTSSTIMDHTKWYYTSEVLNKALADALAAHSSRLKNALESYVLENIGTDASVAGKMPLSDKNGFTTIGSLDTGLFLLVETRVPQNVTSTVDPFLLSLPMTSVDGTNASDGGHRWIYDVTVYPKNQTGGVTLEKLVRESENEEFSHNTTATTGDIVTYQITSTLPTITSAATNLSEYTFVDLLAKGLNYTDEPVKIEWFTDRACSNLVDTWIQGDGNFAVKDEENDDGTHNRTISMTTAGFAKINAPSVTENILAGYSNYTMRITYTAKMNSDESVVYGDESNVNTVVLIWARTSDTFKGKLSDDCHVYSYGVAVSKTFSDKESDAAKAAGLYEHVLFTVQNKTDNLFLITELNEDEGIWYVTVTTDDETKATRMHPVTWNQKDGMLVIKGLEADEYLLVEVETANGYKLLKEPMLLKIVASNDANTSCAPQPRTEHYLYFAAAYLNDLYVTMVNDEADTTSENAIVPLNVENERGFNLPQTGEIGATLLPIIGGSLLGVVAIASAAMIFMIRRKEENT